MSKQKSQKLSTQASKLTSISKESVSEGSKVKSGLDCTSFKEMQQALEKENFIKMQQALEKEKEVYKSFRGHANILELMNTYDLLKNSKVSPIFMNAWMWYSWRKEKRKKSHIEGEVGEEVPLEGKEGEEGPPKEEVKEIAYPEGEGKAFLGMNIYYYGIYVINIKTNKERIHKNTNLN